MMDPLTGACLEPDEIWQMTDEMLVAQEKWLPQYAEAIAQAKKNLAEHYVEPHKEKSPDTFLRLKSVEEIRNDEEERKKLRKVAHKN